ncbi:MAG TPA: hypothetical protein VMW16_00780 [Sedimentisphaerales bacterium]|nr:hypothetical protein [Sedimentisphaerales bacterium]
MKVDKFFTFTVVMVTLLLLSACDTDKPDEDKAEQEAAQLEETAKTRQEIEAMCAKYNAARDWGESWRHTLDDASELMFFPLYTIEVEEALVRTDGRPIALIADVVDVMKEENGYSVQFGELWFNRHSPANDIRFILDCTSEQVDSIIRNRKNWLAHYAVIARISDVKEVQFTKNDEGYFGSAMFMAKGPCLDVLFVGYYEPPFIAEGERAGKE